MSDQDNRPVAISVERVTKTFKLPHEKQNSIKGRLINFKKRGFEKQVALKDISFEVEEGDFFGIVGRNGSGKSTLLKLLAGIYTPTKGNIQVNGKLTPFIELGVGFNPELSGRDNVFLNGALLGFSRSEMAKMYDEIVDFAELERFMDQKLKNYSSGMQVRLAFSIAIRANTDILVLDEVLAVGDSNFQRKCLNYFKELKSQHKTVVFVSHDMAAVQDFCNKVLIIDMGVTKFLGEATKAAAIYNEINFSATPNIGSKTVTEAVHYGEGSATITNISIQKGGKSTRHLTPKDQFSIVVEIKAKKAIENAVLGVQVDDASYNTVLSYNNNDDSLNISLAKGEATTIHLTTENILHNGSYAVSAAIKSSDKVMVYDQILKVANFEVSGWKASTAFIHPNIEAKSEHQK